MTLTPESVVELAEFLARRYHAGQVDRVGVPYIEHPRAVAGLLAGPRRPAGPRPGSTTSSSTPTPPPTTCVAAGVPAEVVGLVEVLTPPAGRGLPRLHRTGLRRSGRRAGQDRRRPPQPRPGPGLRPDRPRSGPATTRRSSCCFERSLPAGSYRIGRIGPNGRHRTEAASVPTRRGPPPGGSMTLTHVPVRSPHDDTIAADSTLIIHRPRRRRWWPGAGRAPWSLVAHGGRARQVTAPALRFDGEPPLWRTAPGDDAAVRRIDNALGTEVTVGFERRARSAPAGAGEPRPLPGQGPSASPSGGPTTTGSRAWRWHPTPRRPFSPSTPSRCGGAPPAGSLLHFRFADCALDHGDGVAASRASLPVDYRVFGLRQREAVPFARFALSVPSGRCDRPVL